MLWMLSQEDVVVIGRDIIVNDDAIWLDWLTSGLLSIGESYSAGQWDTGPSTTLDGLITCLLSVPIAARRQMFHQWDARLVSLLARFLQYPRSCQAAVVGGDLNHLDFDFISNIREDSFLHPGFGLWKIVNENG
jgi:hypothetical protein